MYTMAHRLLQSGWISSLSNVDRDGPQPTQGTGHQLTETVAAIVAAHRAGTMTPAQTVARSYQRIRDYNDPAVFISLRDEKAALADAEALAAKGRERASAFGVPVAVKDNIDALGMPTTAACPAFSYSPAHDSTAVAKLRAAGAIIIGKTNLDQFATGLVGVRSPYGIPGQSDPRRSDSGRIEFGIGGRGFRRTGAAGARHRHRGSPAACRRCSTTSSA